MDAKRFPALANIITSELGPIEWAEVLNQMRALSILYQNAHWLSKGENFYSDHLLYERLYDKSIEEVDRLAERAVGLGFETAPAVEGLAMKLAPEECSLARVMEKEVIFLNLLQELDARSDLAGVKNLLDELSDSHEENLYLLRRRAGG